jgi:hypothetical protein
LTLFSQLDILQPEESMRDDIHKSAPVPAAWRTLMKRCALEADRGTRTTLAAENALRIEIRQELSPGFLLGIRNAANSPQGNLFPIGQKFIKSAAQLGGIGSTFEEQVIQSLNRHSETEGCTPEATKQALQDVISERLEANARAMTGHWLKCGDAQARDAIIEMKTAVRSIDVTQLVADLVQPSPPPPPSPTKKTGSLNLDEDLRKRP